MDRWRENFVKGWRRCGRWGDTPWDFLRAVLCCLDRQKGSSERYPRPCPVFKLGIKCKNANSVQVTSPQAPNKSYRSTSMPKDVNVVSDAKLVIRRRPFCRSRRPSSSRGTRRTSRQCVADCAQNLTQAITMARMRRIGSTVLLVSSQIPFCQPLPAVDEST